MSKIKHFIRDDYTKWCKKHHIEINQPFILDFGTVKFIAVKHTNDEKSSTYKLIKKSISPALYILEGFKKKNGLNYKSELDNTEIKYAYNLINSHKYSYIGVENDEAFIKKIKANKIDIMTWFYIRDTKDLTNFYENLHIKNLNSYLKTKFTPNDVEDNFYNMVNIRQNPIVKDIIKQYQFNRNNFLFNEICKESKKNNVIVIFGFEHGYSLYDVLKNEFGIPKIYQI